MNSILHSWYTPASAIVKLAEAVYNGADASFAMRDALLEADYPELAEHFGKKDHPKGCWVVDMILGRSKPASLAPALVEDGVTLVDFRRHGHSESFEGLIRIARYKIVMQISTKEKALEPNWLSYTLLDVKGGVLSRGTVRSATRLDAGETGDFEIVDAKVNEAIQAVIDRRK